MIPPNLVLAVQEAAAAAPASAGTGAGFDRWIEFVLLVLLLLAFDLFVAHRKAHVVPMKEAAWWSVFWISLALLFNAWVWWEYGEEAASQFLAAYVAEKALSVDNLFIFLTIFSYFKVDPIHRHRVLFYGILGALVMRAIFIFVGLELLQLFEPMFFVFGGLLLFTAWKLMRAGESHFEPEKSLFYRLGRKVLPLSPEYDGGRFFVKRDGRTLGTNMLLVLFIIEGTDVMFALDSVPAVLGISQDLFIVYTSNVFAILGLRALYFLLQGVLQSIPGLQAGLSLVLAYVGLKMCLLPKPFEVHVDSTISLAVILGLLVGSWLVASAMRRAERRREGGPAAEGRDPEGPAG